LSSGLDIVTKSKSPSLDDTTKLLDNLNIVVVDILEKTDFPQNVKNPQSPVTKSTITEISIIKYCKSSFTTITIIKFDKSTITQSTKSQSSNVANPPFLQLQLSNLTNSQSPQSISSLVVKVPKHIVDDIDILCDINLESQYLGGLVLNAPFTSSSHNQSPTQKLLHQEIVPEHQSKKLIQFKDISTRSPTLNQSQSEVSQFASSNIPIQSIQDFAQEQIVNPFQSRHSVIDTEFQAVSMYVPPMAISTSLHFDESSSTYTFTSTPASKSTSTSTSTSNSTSLHMQEYKTSISKLRSSPSLSSSSSLSSQDHKYRITTRQIPLARQQLVQERMYLNNLCLFICNNYICLIYSFDNMKNIFQYFTVVDQLCMDWDIIKQIEQDLWVKVNIVEDKDSNIKKQYQKNII
ncbi:sequence orphan, partial [Reticulomyxa filosa]